jgi:Nucleoside 2-deoxyribosyltransferase like
MKVVTAPEEITNCPSSCLFLAGGITNCPDWQTEILEYLTGENLVVFNPRRSSFKDEDEEEQINWEFRYLRKASAVLFWFCKETLCPITLFELGSMLNLEKKKKLFIGCEYNYKRRKDVEIQTVLIQPEITIVNEVRNLASLVRIWCAENHDGNYVCKRCYRGISRSEMHEKEECEAILAIDRLRDKHTTLPQAVKSVIKEITT